MKPYTGTVVRGDPPPLEFSEDEKQEAIRQNADPRNKAELAREITQARTPKIRAELEREYQRLSKPVSTGTLKPYAGKVIPYAPSANPVAAPAPSPIGGDWENLAAGVGSSFVDLALGVKQRWRELENYTSRGLPGMEIAEQNLAATNREVADKRVIDAPLMATKAGKIGAFTGTVAPALAVGIIPGAQGIAGSMLTGAAMGALAPTTENESVLGNTAVSAALGGAVPAAIRGAKLGKSFLWDPLTKTGIDDRAMKTLETYGVRPEHLSKVDSIQTVTGARPTMAEQIMDPEAAAGAARLQDNLATLPNQQRRFAMRNMENNEARLNTLRDVAGEGGAKTQAVAARKAAADIEYREAYKIPFDLTRMPQGLQKTYAGFMKNPGIMDAMRHAEKEALTRGQKFAPANDLESLHLVKIELDNLISAAEKNNKSTVGLSQTKTELVDFLKNISKRYDTARKGFAARSVPINQMEVAEELIKRGSSPTPDLYGNPQLRVGGLLNALKDEPALIKRATGGLYGGVDSVRGLLDVDQFAKVNAVAEETGRRSAVLGAGLGSGSPTIQRGLGVDILMGGGELATAGKLNLVRGAANFIKGKLIEPRIQETLTEMVLNPGKAQEIIKLLSPKDRSIVQEAIKNRYFQQVLNSTLPALYNTD